MSRVWARPAVQNTALKHGGMQPGDLECWVPALLSPPSAIPVSSFTVHSSSFVVVSLGAGNQRGFASLADCVQVKWTPGLFAISVSVEGRNT